MFFLVYIDFISSQRSKTLVWWDEHPSCAGWVSTTAIGWGVHSVRKPSSFGTGIPFHYLHLGLLVGGAVFELGTVCFPSMEDVSIV